MKSEALNKFQIYYLNRQESHGGGLAIGVDKEIESTLMREGNDDIKALVVHVLLGKIPVNIVVAYGPQDTALKEKFSGRGSK